MQTNSPLQIIGSQFEARKAGHFGFLEQGEDAVSENSPKMIGHEDRLLFDPFWDDPTKQYI